jgi:glycosyltransferase involved in cell wall biosynthesis
MKIVGISHWLSDEAKKSELFKDFDVRTISNNVNSNDFFPIDKKIAKEILGIKTNKKLILAGSTSLKDFYKGFGKYLRAINYLNKDKYLLCFFGNLDKNVTEKLQFEYKYFGFLYDNISLRLLYSASNVFVAPSIMEAFGKTIAESMSCGTPAVCFDTAGPKDIVTHKVDGYLAKPFDAIDLANGIEWVVNSENYDELCQNARAKVISKFDIVKVAAKYKDLYEDILKRGNS